MIIVVDAYNLLRSVPPYKKTITDKERMQFIAQLTAYGRRKGHKIVIVFDGGPHEWPFKETMKTVTVVYSGIHESADDYIKEYIDAHHAKDLLLVSSDSELNRWAHRLNVPSIDSSAFSQLLYQELSTKQVVAEKHSVVTKLHQDNDTAIDIDALMMEASKIVPQKSEDIIVEKIKRHHIKQPDVSKQERALLKKLKKL
jgi:predicted RNA-binding protein with PIN domain